MKTVTPKQIANLSGEAVRRMNARNPMTVRDISRRLKVRIQTALDICDTEWWNIGNYIIED